jgi:hypothetical protein
MPTATGHRDSPATYIVLGDDGRHISLSRVLPPDPATARDIGDKLQRDGRGGWVVRMDGDYWAKTFDVALSEPVSIAPSASSWGEACEAFFLRRRTAIGLPPSGDTQVAA